MIAKSVEMELLAGSIHHRGRDSIIRTIRGKRQPHDYRRSSRSNTDCVLNHEQVGYGQTLYNLGVPCGIDSAFGLSLVMHESTFGTKGEATKSLSFGNRRYVLISVVKITLLNLTPGRAFLRFHINYFATSTGSVRVDKGSPDYSSLCTTSR